MTSGLESKPTALYRLYDAQGGLLYVGITNNTAVRWKQHARDKKWWPEVDHKEVMMYGDREQAALAEVTAIRAENPRHNVSYALDGRLKENPGSSKQIASVLRCAIEDGEYTAGSRLPSNTDLAFSLRCGNETVRRALEILGAEGLVESVHRKGSYVRSRPSREQVYVPSCLNLESGYGFDQLTANWLPVGKIAERWAEDEHEACQALGEPALLREFAIGPAGTGRIQHLITTAVPLSLVVEIPRLASAEAHGDRYVLLEEHAQAPLEFQEIWTGRQASAERCAALRLGSTGAVIARQRRAEANGRLLEITTAVMSGERFALAYKVQRDRTATWPRSER